MLQSSLGIELATGSNFISNSSLSFQKFLYTHGLLLSSLLHCSVSLFFGHITASNVSISDRVRSLSSFSFCKLVSYS